MRKLVYLFPLLCCLAFTTCQQSSANNMDDLETKQGFDEAAELAAIMKVIENETACFFARDYNCWKENWVNEDYAFQAWSNADGTYDAKVGWSEVDRQTGNYIKENPESNFGSIQSFQTERLNMRTKFYGNQVAHLVWEQYNGNAEQDAYQISQEVRLMEKVNGKWKIVTVAAFWDYKNKIAAETVDAMRES
ncbi:MAG: hypothetical protein AAGA31_05045 [Bacteroidota bacterium]